MAGAARRGRAWAQQCHCTMAGRSDRWAGRDGARCRIAPLRQEPARFGPPPQLPVATRGHGLDPRATAISRQGEIVIMTQSSKDKNFGEIFSENRVPIALIGAGIAWLLANRTGLTERLAEDERVQAAKRRIGEFGASSSPFSSSKTR